MRVHREEADGPVTTVARKRGLAPVAGRRPKVLVLGSFPGEESLRRGEYYAFSRNQFWQIIFAVLGESDPVDYEERKRLLVAGGIALWDVIATCERSGSADGAIQNPTANDLCAFLERNPTVECVCFNGNKAAETFARLVAPGCGRQRARLVALPSTSPAHARMRLEEKLDRWREAMAGHLADLPGEVER